MVFAQGRQECGRLAKNARLETESRRASKNLERSEMVYVIQIGNAWEKQIRNQNTCVGLSISDFTRSLGGFYPAWYATVYAEDSQSVHQSDLLNYLDCNEQEAMFSPLWFTSPELVKGTLVRAALMFNQCINEMHVRFRFDRELVSQVRQCADRLVLDLNTSG